LGIIKDTPEDQAGIIVIGHGVEARQGNVCVSVRPFVIFQSLLMAKQFDCGWGSRVSNFPNQCLGGLRYLSGLGTR
jgi:hypothetical protein